MADRTPPPRGAYSPRVAPAGGPSNERMPFDDSGALLNLLSSTVPSYVATRCVYLRTSFVCHDQ